MADQNAKFDPLAEVRQRYPGLATWNDETILQHLSDPNKFRSAFPEYSHLNDATIRHNIGQYASSMQSPSPGSALASPSKQGQSTTSAPGNHSFSTAMVSPTSTNAASTTRQPVQPGQFGRQPGRGSEQNTQSRLGAPQFSPYFSSYGQNTFGKPAMASQPAYSATPLAKPSMFTASTTATQQQVALRALSGLYGVNPRLLQTAYAQRSAGQPESTVLLAANKHPGPAHKAKPVQNVHSGSVLQNNQRTSVRHQGPLPKATQGQKPKGQQQEVLTQTPPPRNNLINTLKWQALDFEVPVDFALAVADQESRFDINALHKNFSKKGKLLSTDYGVMQFNSGNRFEKRQTDFENAVRRFKALVKSEQQRLEARLPAEEKKLRNEIALMQKRNSSPNEIKALDEKIQAFQELQRQRKTPAQMRDEVEARLEDYLEKNHYFRDAGNKVIKVDENRLKTDWGYNVEVGMSLLRDSYEFAKSHVPKNRDGSQNRDELFKMTYLYYHLGDHDAKRYVNGDMPENQSREIESVIDQVFNTRYKPTNDRVQNFLEGKPLESPRPHAPK